jgi:hypothetical protein
VIGVFAATVKPATFTELDGPTTLTLHIRAKNKVSRDAIIDSGMDDGICHVDDPDRSGGTGPRRFSTAPTVRSASAMSSPVL